MTIPGLAPRTGLGGVVAVWIAAAAIAVAIGLAAPSDWRAAWMPLGLAGCLLLAFAIQLAGGRADGFLHRIAASVLGAMLVMGLVGLGLGLATLFAV